MKNCRQPISHRPLLPRRGIAALFVLLLLSVTLALSYAAMRSQSVSERIHQNARRRPSAQQAAITGLTLAIKKMSTASWAGIGTPYSGSLGPYESFQVTYTTGDLSLSSSSSSWSDYPYRVTLIATGYSADPDNPQSLATYKIRAVVRLVPRAMADEPSNWATMTGYTFYQTAMSANAVVVPSRIEGPVYFQGQMSMSREIWPSDDTIRQRYYNDLNAYRVAKGIDDRPFNANVSYASLLQYADTPTLLATLGISTSATIAGPDASWNPAAEIATYRLYAGGAQYHAQTIANSQQNVAMQPNVLTNPLGIYLATGGVDAYANATFRGTLIAGGDVTIRGTGVRFDPVSLPALYSSTMPIQLPVLVGGGQFTIRANTAATITGQVSLASTFKVATGSQTAKPLSFTGQLIAGSVNLQGRSEWLGKSSSRWNLRYNNFLAQYGTPNGTSYFPEYLKKIRFVDPTPRVIIKPSATATRYHWQTWMNSQNAENPIFVPASGDLGLRWDLLEWTENPPS